MLATERLRQDFPLLQKTIDGKEIVYLDNACMSLRPESVIETITRYYTDLSACGGRSNHRLARQVSEEVEEARQKVQRFIKAKKPEEVLFTRNTSESLNLVANSLAFEAGDVVVISGKEHNSNLVPWLKLKEEKGIEVKVLLPTPEGGFNTEALAQMLDHRTKLVSVVMTSNLDGETHPIKEIVRLAHQSDTLVMVDAAQAAPHMPIDVQDLGVDFLAFSGHKMLGPSGTGVLYGKKELLEEMKGFMVGGDTVESTSYTSYTLLPIPEKFEAGLQDYAGIMGLGAAVDYLTTVGLESIHEHEVSLNRLITEGIRDFPGLKILGPSEPEKRGGIVSFTVEGVDPHQISLMLDETEGIMVRSGRHCVHSWFDAQSIIGSTRASLYFYNTETEAEKFVSALKTVLAVLS